MSWANPSGKKGLSVLQLQKVESQEQQESRLRKDLQQRQTRLAYLRQQQDKEKRKADPSLHSGGELAVLKQPGVVPGNVQLSATFVLPQKQNEAPRLTSGHMVRLGLLQAEVDVRASLQDTTRDGALVLMKDRVPDRLFTSSISQALPALHSRPLQLNPSSVQGAKAKHRFTPAAQLQGEAKLPTSVSFHSTPTKASSTMRSSEENTQGVAGQHPNSLLSNVAGAEAAEAAKEDALPPKLKTFRSCDSLLSIAKGSCMFLGRPRGESPIGKAELPSSDSFHSTSTMTSSPVYTSEENTPETAGRHRVPRLFSVAGGLADEAVNELIIPEGSYTSLGRHRDGSHIDSSLLPTAPEASPAVVT